jgi:hypothetical protein
MRSSLRSVLLATSVLLALQSPAADCQRSAPPRTEQKANGISVGEPKVFDNRTLQIMLDSLSASLQSLQSQPFVDQKTLADALATIQGFHSNERNTAVSLLGPSTPTVTSTVPAGGTTLVPNSVTTTGVTPTTPQLTEIPAFSGFTPNFGQSAGDLLNDSTNLNYQITNLRLILERALSDRLSGDKERLQTVLGFNVTIDPPQTAADSVAVVEITLKTAGQSGSSVTPTLSLVALMPQANTYNAAALSSRSNAFGGSAVVHTFQVGLSSRTREQTFYLYRDADTVAYERMTGNPGEVTFGWMFRPVLGRRAVAPGFRQMFAIAALPGADCDTCASQTLTATARTYWKKYDSKTLTSFEDCDASLGTRFRYAATLGLAKPEIFQLRYRNSIEFPRITVNTTHGYESSLHPVVHDVRWTPVGASNALLTIEGDNFFTGTQIILGDKIYGPAEGLTLKSNHTMQLMITQDALASGPAMVSGRYATPVPLESAKEEINKLPRLRLLPVQLGPSIGGKRKLTVSLMGCCDDRGDSLPLRLNDVPDDQHPPLININGHAAQQPYQRFQIGGRISYETSIGDDSLEKGFLVVQLTWPFLPRRFSMTRRANDPDLDYEIARVGEGSVVIKSHTPSGFVNRVDDPDKPLTEDQCWQLFSANVPIILTTKNCPGRLRLPTKAGTTGSKSAKSEKKTTEPKAPVVIAAGPNAIAVTLESVPDRVVLLEPIEQATYFLDVPKFNAPPKAEGGPTATINQFDSVIVPLTVKKAVNVASVAADLKPLTFKPKSLKADETTINVQIPRDLSEEPGSVDLTIVDKQGNPTTARLVINAVTVRKQGGK